MTVAELMAVDVSDEQWASMMAAAEEQARLREQIDGAVEQMETAIRMMGRTRDLLVRLRRQADPADPEILFVHRGVPDDGR